KPQSATAAGRSAWRHKVGFLLSACKAAYHVSVRSGLVPSRDSKDEDGSSEVLVLSEEPTHNDCRFPYLFELRCGFARCGSGAFVVPSSARWGQTAQRGVDCDRRSPLRRGG